ncbi:MAG: hypothetical protein E7291_08735 [Lachnospiraceae bacterium]|nr:hypothetical protein [Lachnospiraceae bacterium]
MRKYEEEPNGKLIQVVCNQCKKELKVENGYLKEGCFTTDFVFGYFSKKDGTRHQLDLCEECYDKMVAQFQIPVEESDARELL